MSRDNTGPFILENSIIIYIQGFAKIFHSVSLKVLAFLLASPTYFQDVFLIRKNCTGQERLREFEVRPLLFAVGSDEAENQV